MVNFFYMYGSGSVFGIQIQFGYGSTTLIRTLLKFIRQCMMSNLLSKLWIEMYRYLPHDLYLCPAGTVLQVALVPLAGSVPSMTTAYYVVMTYCTSVQLVGLVALVPPAGSVRSMTTACPLSATPSWTTRPPSWPSSAPSRPPPTCSHTACSPSGISSR